MDVFKEFKKLSITSYLINQGLAPEESNKSKTWFSSPFGSDRTASFIVYEKTNTFYDWSSGVGGDIITLVKEINNCSPMEAIKILAEGSTIPIHTDYSFDKKKDHESFKNFNYKTYLLKDKNLIRKVNEYANSRKITSHYHAGKFFERKGDKNNPSWLGIPSIMFIHRDEDFDICGAKFRIIEPKGKRRFSSRGRLCYYVVENFIHSDAKVFVVESETSANSLLNICKEFEISCYILSVGGVHSVPDRIPEALDGYPVSVIIDYDGDEELYNKRISKYKHLGDGIKIPLPKGEDINSLYCNGNYEFLKKILI